MSRQSRRPSVSKEPSATESTESATIPARHKTNHPRSYRVRNRNWCDRHCGRAATQASPRVLQLNTEYTVVIDESNTSERPFTPS